MVQLSVSLLGTFQARLESQSLTEFESDKARALLTYLIVESGHPHQRDYLAGLLWPDWPDTHARANLRHTLNNLRTVLHNREAEPPFLLSDRQTIQFNPDSDYRLDVAEFSQALARLTEADSGQADEQVVQAWEWAVQLYTGPFMHGFFLPDCSAFEEWLLLTRERLQLQMLAALRALAPHFEQQDHYKEAQRYVRRQLELDPLQEDAHAHLMRLLALTGQRSAALVQFETCRQLLIDELGVEPGPEITALHRQIQTGKLGRGKGVEEQGGRKLSAERGLRGGEIRSSGPHQVDWDEASGISVFYDRQAELDGPQLKEEIPFVARERELSELAAALQTARAGQGQILFVVGGAGRGKTMLVQEFTRRAQAAEPDLIAVSGHCNAHTGLGDPYLPFREALTMLTGDIEAKLATGLIASAHARRLLELMPLTVPALMKQAPDLIGSLVPVEPLLKRTATFASPEVPWFKQLMARTAPEPSPGLEQKQILAQYTSLLKIVAAQRPLLLILEDLHWVDVSSNALLFHLSREVENDRILIVGTYRPDEVAVSRGEVRHPLAQTIGEIKRQHGDIWLDLGELAPAEGQQFVAAYLDTQPNRLGRAFREALFRRTGGHALFTVELLREMQERGDLRRDVEGYWVEAAAIDWAKLPARVEGVIEIRLSRLSEEMQAILTIASIEGEIFTAEVVARVQQMNERGLVQQLSRELDKQHRLVTAQALDRVGQQRLSLYRFRHYLFQHYLYHHLAEAERVYLHEAVGNELEQLYGEQTEEVAVELARHFEAAGLMVKAVHYLYQAGSRAVQLSANEEAFEHFNRALALLQTLPESLERNRQELALQIALGAPLTIIKGYHSPELEQAFSRAWQLHREVSAQGAVQVEDVPQLFHLLYGLWSLKLARAELLLARELAEQVLDLAQHQSDSFLLMPAHWVVGNTLFYLGEFVTAQEHFEQSMAHYDPRHHRSHVLLFGQDQGVTCLAFQAWNLWELGYPDQALKRSREALTLAEALAHPHSLVYATIFAAHLHLRCREWSAVQQQAEIGIALSTEHDILYWPSEAMGPLGKALVEQGRVEEGIVLIHQGLAAWRVQGIEVCLPYTLALLAEAYAQVGQVEAGLNTVTEALAVVEKTAEHLSEPELYRLRGELLLNASREGREARRNDEREAEACFWQAIEIARRQGAKSLELRAVMSLSRLWQKQRKQKEADKILTEIYGWFSEGFDTPDLQEAKVLLEELQQTEGLY